MGNHGMGLFSTIHSSPTMISRKDLTYSRQIQTINGLIVVESEPLGNGHIVSVSKLVEDVDQEDYPLVKMDSTTNQVVSTFGESLDILGNYEKLEI